MPGASLWVYSRESQREEAGHIHKGIRGRRQNAHTLESEGGSRPFTGSIKGKRQDVHRKNQREDTSRSQEKPEGGGKIALRRIRGRRQATQRRNSSGSSPAGMGARGRGTLEPPILPQSGLEPGTFMSPRPSRPLWTVTVTVTAALPGSKEQQCGDQGDRRCMFPATQPRSLEH